MIDWVKSNLDGKEKSFLPLPYNWKTYGDMNIEFWKKHQITSLTDAKNMFYNSHKQIINLIDKFTNEDLFSKGAFKWCGTTLGSYFVSVSASHYDWAIKKIKAHQKNCSK